MVWEEKIFKVVFFPLVLITYLKKFEKGPHKEHSCEIW